MLIDRTQPARPKRLAVRPHEERRAIGTENVPGERPVGQPDRMLEAAAPVDAERIRRLLEPRIEQHATAIEITRVATQVPRLRERHELEVPVDLPEILDVADIARIAVVEALTEHERRDRSRLWILVPFGREAERRTLHREHMERSKQDLIRCRGVFLLVEVPWQRGQPRVAGRPHRLRRARQPEAPALRARPHGAPDTKGNLAAAHGAHASHAPLEAQADVLAGRVSSELELAGFFWVSNTAS